MYGPLRNGISANLEDSHIYTHSMVVIERDNNGIRQKGLLIHAAQQVRTSSRKVRQGLST